MFSRSARPASLSKLGEETETETEGEGYGSGGNNSNNGKEGKTIRAGMWGYPFPRLPGAAAAVGGGGGNGNGKPKKAYTVQTIPLPVRPSVQWKNVVLESLKFDGTFLFLSFLLSHLADIYP